MEAYPCAVDRSARAQELARVPEARAINRCGELLRQIPDTNRGRPPNEIQEGALPNLTRTVAATAAGLSEHQRKTALRVANMPQGARTDLASNEAMSQADAATMLNLKRGHLDESQRAMVAARVASLPRGANQHASNEAP